MGWGLVIADCAPRRWGRWGLDCGSHRSSGGSRAGEMETQTPPAAESGLFCDGWCGVVTFGQGEAGKRCECEGERFPRP